MKFKTMKLLGKLIIQNKDNLPPAILSGIQGIKNGLGYNK